MKRALTLTISCIIALTVIGQSPERMSFQAVIRNSSDQLVVNSTIGMQISILQSSVLGLSVYVETHKPKSNSNGLITVEIGDGSVVSGTFASIDWSKGPYFIKTETDPTGGTNYTITGTSQLLSVPYALYAKTAGNGFSGSFNDLSNKPTIPANVSQLNNDKGYLSKFMEKDSSITNEIQSLNIRNDTVFLSHSGGFFVLPKPVSTSSNLINNVFFESSGILSNAMDSSIRKYGFSYAPYSTDYRSYSFLIPFDGQIKNLIAAPIQNSVANGSTVNVIVLINGKPSNLTLDITNLDGFNFKINNTESIPVKQGDYIALKYVSKGSVAPGTNFSAIVELASNPKPNVFEHYIGELYGGGIVVSVWKDTSGEHGLIASLKDLNSGVDWSNVSSTLIGSSAQSRFDGRLNTKAIIGQTGHNSGAAYICDTITYGGFNDWYLPSIWELSQCFNSAFIINTKLGATNGFGYGNYWSSTEVKSEEVFTINFGGGNVGGNLKNQTDIRLRAVRRY